MTKQITRSSTAGLMFSALITLLLTLSAVGKIVGVQPVGESFEKFGLKNNMLLIGIGELASAWLFLIPRTSSLGLLLLSAHLGGAIATHLQHGESYIVPAVLLLLIWIAGYVRHPEILQSFHRRVA
jgi:hypothetical protein